MNGIEKILEKLQSDSQTEADAIISQAKQEAADITAHYDALAQRETAELEERGKRAADERQDRLVRAAEMESKKMLLATKQEMLDRAFDLAREKLSKLPEAEYISLLASLASQSAGTGEETVVLNEKDRASIGEKVVAAANEQRKAAGKPGSLTLSKETAETGGGLLLRDKESEVNCTFDTLLYLSREELAAQAASILFG